MLRILWPTALNPVPSLLGRLGRVVHWALVAYAVFVLPLAALNLQIAMNLENSLGMVMADGTLSPEKALEAAKWHWRQASKHFFNGVTALVVGRAARYVLSSE